MIQNSTSEKNELHSLNFNTLFTSSCFNIFSLYCLSLLQFFLGGDGGLGWGLFASLYFPSLKKFPIFDLDTCLHGHNVLKIDLIPDDL